MQLATIYEIQIDGSTEEPYLSLERTIHVQCKYIKKTCLLDRQYFKHKNISRFFLQGKLAGLTKHASLLLILVDQLKIQKSFMYPEFKYPIHKENEKYNKAR